MNTSPPQSSSTEIAPAGTASQVSDTALTKDQLSLLRILLTVSLATGIIDAICLVHFKVFTAYMTGTLIVIGVHLGGAAPLAFPGLIALAAFGTGAAIGGRLIRFGTRDHVSHIRMLAQALTVVTCLVLAVTLVIVICDPTDTTIQYLCVALLGIAMGIQIAGSRQAGVQDMTIPAATMVLHGLFFDCLPAGGKGDRQGRRLSVVIALILGAVIGTGLGNWHLWAGLLAGATLLAIATGASYALARKLGPDITS